MADAFDTEVFQEQAAVCGCENSSSLFLGDRVQAFC